MIYKENNQNVNAHNVKDFSKKNRSLYIHPKNKPRTHFHFLYSIL